MAIHITNMNGDSYKSWTGRRRRWTGRQEPLTRVRRRTNEHERRGRKVWFSRSHAAFSSSWNIFLMFHGARFLRSRLAFTLPYNFFTMFHVKHLFLRCCLVFDLLASSSHLYSVFTVHETHRQHLFLTFSRLIRNPKPLSYIYKDIRKLTMGPILAIIITKKN